MKKIIVLRLLIGLGLIIPFAKKIFLISFLHVPEFLEEAQRLAGRPIGVDQLVSFMQKQAIADSVILLALIPLLYSLVLKRLENRGRLALVYPASLLISVLVGVGLAYLDQYINPYFTSGFAMVTGQSSSFDLFFRLQIDNTIDVLNICFVTGLIYRIEKLLFSPDVKMSEILNRTNIGFWVVLSITLVPVLFIIYPNSFITTDQLFYVLPQILFVSFLSLIVALFFLHDLSKRPEFSIKLFFISFQKTLFPSLGILAAVLIARTWQYESTLAFGDFYAGLIVTSIIYTFTVCAFSYLLLQLNIGGIKNAMKLKLKLTKSVSQLDLLKSQVNPHFLFNSLNTLYGLALQEESPKTSDGIQKLSDMMRFMLEEKTADKIPLSREIDYIHNYIDLQSLRLAKSSDIELNIDIDEVCSGEITPMLIIPFIENAFKHGISLREESWVKIQLSCTSHEVSLTIKNTNHAKDDPMGKQNGIGIDNVRKRLAIIYPEVHNLEIEDKDKVYTVSLKIPLR